MTLFTIALLINLSFVLLWIDAGNLSYTYMLQPSLWSWMIFTAMLFSCLNKVSKYGGVISIVLLLIYTLFLVANLMYYSVFNTQISLSAYGMISNLHYFMDSVADTFNIKFIILPAIPIIGCFFLIFSKDIIVDFHNWILLTLSFIIMILSFNTPQPFGKTYGQLRLTHNENAATTILFSPFTNLIFQYLEKSNSDIENPKAKIDSIVASNMNNLIDRSNGRKYDALVIIIIESLESFVIGLEIEGIAITPNLTKLTQAGRSLFAPMIVPKVGIARSMDAQLIINCGVLPPSNEAFCFTYPSNDYPGIAKAMTDRRHIGTTYSITSDMPSTYNQTVISKRFGYKNLLTRNDFTTEPTSLIHVDDSVFIAQTKELLTESLWAEHESAVIQLVTYSTHQPFKLPKSAIRTEFKGLNPKLAKYLNVVNYTDRAIGNFIKYLQDRDDYSSTLVVITGDHNVFSESRYRELGITELSNYHTPCVPLIILNSEINGIVNHSVPQTAIYTTLLELLGITDYAWTGIERSIFHTDSFSTDTITYDKQRISDYIIRHNYWGKPFQ